MTLPDYISRERQAEAGRFAQHTREAARASGVCYSGMGPGPFVARTDAEIVEAATAKHREACAFEVSPAGRFLICVSAIQSAAKTAGDLPLYSACARALACCSRGLAGELDHAGKCLAEIELCGGDVTEARGAPADLAAPALLMAGE